MYQVGCGSGLVGIFCLLSGADSLLFQDFNQEVIEYYTLPNIMVNTNGKLSHQELEGRVSLIHGDWDQVVTSKELDKFDTIVSSETIYSPDNYPKLTRLIKRCLKPDGKVLIAAKSHYFGVGGGTGSFKSYLEANRGEIGLKHSIVSTINSGVTREILMLTFC